MTHRLFLAIRPPAPIRNQLLALMEGLGDIRWQEEDQLHLTLRYIGEANRRHAEDIALALGSVAMEGFSLALAGVGSFDKRGKVNAIWAGIAPKDAVARLHHKLDHALVRLGLPAEGRAFVPHITLARSSRTPHGLADWLATYGALASDAFPVTEFILYESHLGSNGARYEVIARYPLHSTKTVQISTGDDALAERSG